MREASNFIIPDDVPLPANSTKTAVIQYYASQGMKVKDISKKLNLPYQQCYQAVQKGASGASGISIQHAKQPSKAQFGDAINASHNAYAGMAVDLTKSKGIAAQGGWEAARDLLGVTCGIPQQERMTDSGLRKAYKEWVRSWVSTSTSPDIAAGLAGLNEALGKDKFTSFTDQLVAHYNKGEKFVREKDSVGDSSYGSVFVPGISTSPYDAYRLGHQFVNSDLHEDVAKRYNALPKTSLYRGTNGEESKLFDGAGEGDIVSLKGLISTSTGREKAKQFGPVMLTFKDVEGHLVFASDRLDSDLFSMHAAEKETILFGNMIKWRVEKVVSSEIGHREFVLVPDVSSIGRMADRETAGIAKADSLSHAEMLQAKSMHISGGGHMQTNAIAAKMKKSAKAVYDAIHHGSFTPEENEITLAAQSDEDPHMIKHLLSKEEQDEMDAELGDTSKPEEEFNPEDYQIPLESPTDKIQTLTTINQFGQKIPVEGKHAIIDMINFYSSKPGWTLDVSEDGTQATLKHALADDAINKKLKDLATQNSVNKYWMLGNTKIQLQQPEVGDFKFSIVGDKIHIMHPHYTEPKVVSPQYIKVTLEGKPLGGLGDAIHQAFGGPIVKPAEKVVEEPKTKFVFYNKQSYSFEPMKDSSFKYKVKYKGKEYVYNNLMQTVALSDGYGTSVSWSIKQAIKDAFTMAKKVTESLREAESQAPLSTSMCGPVPDFVMSHLHGESLKWSFLEMQGERETFEGVLSASVENGWTRKQLSGVIQQVFNEGVHRTDPQTGKVTSRVATAPWAKMVARTELNRAHSEGEMVMYELAGVQELEWTAANDPNTCPECEGADGEIVKRGEPFPFVDVEMSPAHPSCECAVIPSDEDLITKRSNPEHIAWASRGGRTADEYEAQFGSKHFIDRNK